MEDSRESLARADQSITLRGGRPGGRDNLRAAAGKTPEKCDEKSKATMSSLGPSFRNVFPLSKARKSLRDH